MVSIMFTECTFHYIWCHPPFLSVWYSCYSELECNHAMHFNLLHYKMNFSAIFLREQKVTVRPHCLLICLLSTCELLWTHACGYSVFGEILVLRQMRERWFYCWWWQGMYAVASGMARHGKRPVMKSIPPIDCAYIYIFYALFSLLCHPPFPSVWVS